MTVLALSNGVEHAQWLCIRTSFALPINVEPAIQTLSPNFWAHTCSSHEHTRLHTHTHTRIPSCSYACTILLTTAITHIRSGTVLIRQQCSKHTLISTGTFKYPNTHTHTHTHCLWSDRCRWWTCRMRSCTFIVITICDIVSVFVALPYR